MINLVYVSSATRQMSEDELLQLMQQSKLRNSGLNVTGMLLYVDGNFIQVLEGDADDVHAVYSSILKDPRNTGHIVLQEKPITERVFPEWQMGFRYLTRRDIGELEGYTWFLEKDINPEEIANHSDDAVKLLYSFKKTNLPHG